MPKSSQRRSFVMPKGKVKPRGRKSSWKLKKRFTSLDQSWTEKSGTEGMKSRELRGDYFRGKKAWIKK